MFELIIIIIILIITILIIMFLSKSYENFKNEDVCKNFYKNSYCELNVDNKKCNCKLQKDNLKYLFNSPENCCQRNCQNLSPEECVEKKEFTSIPYYCNIGGECKKYTGTIIESHIATNNCGTDPLNNQLLLPYVSLEECKKDLNPCDKYNDPKKSSHINQAECIKDVNCGYCTNSTGGGKCIIGTAEGPADLQKYFFCNPQIKNNDNQNNRYIYGNHADYILQKPDISFSKISK